MKRVLTTCAAIAAAGCLMGFADDHANPGKKIANQIHDRGAPDMAAYMAAGEPGAAHEFLGFFAGTWDTEMKMWMEPGEPGMTASGRSVVKTIFGGRFIEEHFKSEIMGMPFEGRGFTGFDNNKKLFIGTWMDSMSTGVSTQYGSISPDGTVLTMVGTMDEPMTGEMGKAVMSTIEIVDENTHVMKMYDVLYGEQTLAMEITYRRVLEAAQGE